MMYRKAGSLVMAVLISVICLASGGCDEEIKQEAAFSEFHDMVQERVHKPVFPEYSDVSMRTLTIRDVPYDHQKNIFRMAPAFHVTRVDWSYVWHTQREIEAVKKLQEMGYHYTASGAQHIPCWIGDRAPVDWKRNIVMTDIDGNPSVMPFIRSWKNPQLIGDISNPEYYKGHLEHYKKMIDYGADGLQRDAADHHRLAVTICGGGFTPTGVAGFTKWLDENVSDEKLAELGVEDISEFNYKQYLLDKGAPKGDDFSRKYKGPFKEYWYQYWEDTSLDFFRRLVRDVKDYAGWDIPFSCNNGSFQKWGELEQIFDFCISELMMVSSNPEHIRERLLIAENLGKFQITGSPKLLGLEVEHHEKTDLNKKVMATFYSNGALGQVPWDTFEQTPDGGGRFFGKPEDYATVSGFVRGIADYLDGYERAYDYSTRGILTDGIDPNDKPMKIKGTDNEVCSFVRINKEQASKPIVVHLVDWGKPLVKKSKEGSDVWELGSGKKIDYVRGLENLKRTKGEPFKLVIDKDAFDVAAAKLNFTLLSPKPYNKQTHMNAERTKDYSELVGRQEVSWSEKDGMIHVDIPKLDPWGVLLIDVK